LPSDPSCHLIRPPCCHKAYLRADHFDGGGSVWLAGRLWPAAPK
jgi:hypothetical protein